jgi:hypothetical protein
LPVKELGNKLAINRASQQGIVALGKPPYLETYSMQEVHPETLLKFQRVLHSAFGAQCHPVLVDYRLGFFAATHCFALQAIWLGAVPIIQKSPMDWLYEGMPVLLVEHFSMVNSSLLESYAAAKNGTADNTEKAWAVYWNQELQQRQRLLCGTAGYQLRG